MTPFRAKDRAVWKMRLSVKGKKPRTFSCGTSDASTAEHVVQMVKSLKRRRQVKPLEAVLDGKITLGALFDAYEIGAVDTLLQKIRDVEQADSIPDLSKLLGEWNGSETYKTQIRRMIPEGAKYPVTRFNKRTISEFLASLKMSSHVDQTPTETLVSGSTRNRYRAALSVFAAWLVERDILTENPVREVKPAKANPARELWLSREQAKLLIDRLPSPINALEALMAATGMELGAALKTSRRDIDLDEQTVHAHGSKTPWRNRVVRATEDWAWKVFERHVKTLLPSTPVFGVRGDRAYKVHVQLSKDLKIPVTTIHDWRHTYAVWSLKDGMRPEVVARQLGHKDATLVQKIYGRYIPTAEDYKKTRRLTHSATPRVKTGSKRKQA